MVQHEREGLGGRPVERGVRVGHGVPDRNVERVDRVAAQHLGHLRNEVEQPLHRHEIFLQHVGSLLARRRLEFGDVVTCFVIAPVHGTAQVQQRVDEAFAALLAQRQFRNGPKEVLVQRIGLAQRLQVQSRGRRLFGFFPCDGAHRAVVRCIQIGVVEHGFRVATHRVLEVGPIFSQRHHAVNALDAFVLGQVQLHFNHDTERAVAADRTKEKLRPFAAAGADEFAVVQHQPDAAHRQHERPQAHVAAVAVHAERAADSEVGVGLHDLHRQAVRIDEALDVAPAHAGLHDDGLVARRERNDAVHRAHVEMQAARACRLAAHAEAATADRHRTGGAAQRLLNVLGRARCDDRHHAHRVQLGHVVDDVVVGVHRWGSLRCVTPTTA